MGSNTSILRITLLSVILLSGIGFAFNDAFAVPSVTGSSNSTIANFNGQNFTVNIPAGTDTILSVGISYNGS